MDFNLEGGQTQQDRDKNQQDFKDKTIECDTDKKFGYAVENFKENNCKGGKVLHESSTAFRDSSYKIKVDEKVILEESGEPSKDFNEMLDRRHNSELVTDTGICPSVGTTFVMILDLFNGEEHLGKFMVLTTREKAEGLWGAGISGYVNIEKNNNQSPISNTMTSEVHEEVIPITPDGKWVHFHFEDQDDSNNVTIFGENYDYSDGRIDITKRKLPSFLPCSPCCVEEQEKNIFLDPHNNNGQIVDCGYAKIDLSKYMLSFIHSESAFNAQTKKIDEKLNENGIVLMKLDDKENPTGEFFQLKVGKLIPVKGPAILSELFSVKKRVTSINRKVEIAVSNEEGVVNTEDFLSRFRQRQPFNQQSV